MPPEVEPPWWRNAVIYEVYPRSFADGNGDGQGDLAGLIDRLPYLVRLGVDAIWVAPWYPSPLADGGYDVTDYREIHPLFGTLAEAEDLVRRAHDAGLRVIIDLVANHTSADHPWFREALAGAPGAPARSRYHFRDGRGPDGSQPPNNWISAFGGPAWSRVTEPSGTPGQWYLHTFAPQQPDLDWQNPEVAVEFDDVLRFWLDRDVDGFRVDAAPAMAKGAGLPDADHGPALAFAPADWVDHPQWDVDALHDIFRRWRAVLDGYAGDRLFVAEAVVNGPTRLARYVRPGQLHTAFNFDFMRAPWDAVTLRRVVDATLHELAPTGAPATWALSSHDEVRHLTRLGRRETSTRLPTSAADSSDVGLGTRRARAAALLSLALPGGAYVYQGDELGLAEVEDLADEDIQDPVFVRTHGVERGRDGCRVPLPWSGDRAPFGFTAGPARPWLPQPAGWSALTAEKQADDPGSMLSLYRRAIEVRAGFRDEPGLSWLSDLDGPVLDFVRGDRLRCVVNLSGDPVDLPAPATLASAPTLPAGRLPPDCAAWIVPATQVGASYPSTGTGARA